MLETVWRLLETAGTVRRLELLELFRDRLGSADCWEQELLELFGTCLELLATV
jgi:hypothetical protein